MNCLRGIATFCSRGQKEEEEQALTKNGDSHQAGSAQPAPQAAATQKLEPAKAVVSQAEAMPKVNEPTPAGQADLPKAPTAPAASAAPKAAASTTAKPTPDSVKKAESNGSQPKKAEKRRAQDGKWYTKDDFIKYFGKRGGEDAWRYAQR